MADGARFTHRFDVRYFEVDQQGVVFNMWYFAYLDDAMTALLAHHGLNHAALLAEGYDVQLVHTDLDWTGSLGWGADAAVDIALARLGRTSFTLQFAVRDGDDVVATASTVYVTVAADGSGKKEIPALLKKGLGPVAPLRPEEVGDATA